MQTSAWLQTMASDKGISHNYKIISKLFPEAQICKFSWVSILVCQMFITSLIENLPKLTLFTSVHINFFASFSFTNFEK